jgi:hypothetical protein
MREKTKQEIDYIKQSEIDWIKYKAITVLYLCLVIFDLFIIPVTSTYVISTLLFICASNKVYERYYSFWNSEMNYLFSDKFRRRVPRIIWRRFQDRRHFVKNAFLYAFGFMCLRIIYIQEGLIHVIITIPLCYIAWAHFFDDPDNWSGD